MKNALFIVSPHSKNGGKLLENEKGHVETHESPKSDNYPKVLKN